MKSSKILLSISLVILFALTGCGNEPDYASPDDGTGYGFTEESSSATNPVSAYSSIEKAQNAIGFAFASPASLPAGYSLKEISVVNDGTNCFAQINYKKGSDHNITYRVSQSTSELNADRSTYEKEKVITISESEITCACNNDITFVASWQKDGCYYCIMADEGLDTTTISTLISSIR